MGYSYSQNYTTGRWLLCCDNCGKHGGVRKRTCPHKVLSDSHRSQTRYSLPYCYPSALCGPCYTEIGSKALHADCAAGAAESQARDDATQALLDAGEKLVVSASSVAGTDQVDVTFAGDKYSDRETVRMPSSLYDMKERTLTEYTALIGAMA